MQTHFDVVIKSVHTISVNLPQMGDTILPAGQEVQLLNASVDTINYLRNTFSGTGVSIFIGKKAAHPCLTHDYKQVPDSVKVKEEQLEKAQPQHLSPLEKVSNYELPSGKHKGKKLKDLDENTLRLIARGTKTQVVKSAIEAYLNLK